MHFIGAGRFCLPRRCGARKRTEQKTNTKAAIGTSLNSCGSTYPATKVPGEAEEAYAGDLKHPPILPTLGACSAGLVVLSPCGFAARWVRSGSWLQPCNRRRAKIQPFPLCTTRRRGLCTQTAPCPAWTFGCRQTPSNSFCPTSPPTANGALSSAGRATACAIPWDWWASA